MTRSTFNPYAILEIGINVESAAPQNHGFRDGFVAVVKTTARLAGGAEVSHTRIGAHASLAFATEVASRAAVTEVREMVAALRRSAEDDFKFDIEQEAGR